MPNLYLIIAAVAGPLLFGGGAYLIQEVRMGWAVDAAVATEKDRSKGECENRITSVKAQVEAQSAQEVLNQFNEAAQAAWGIGPTPVDRAELQMVCDKDRLCREKKP